MARSVQKNIHINLAARKDGRLAPAVFKPSSAATSQAHTSLYGAPPSTAPELSSTSVGGSASPLAPLLPPAMDPIVLLGRFFGETSGGLAALAGGGRAGGSGGGRQRSPAPSPGAITPVFSGPAARASHVLRARAECAQVRVQRRPRAKCVERSLRVPAGRGSPRRLQAAAASGAASTGAAGVRRGPSPGRGPPRPGPAPPPPPSSDSEAPAARRGVEGARTGGILIRGAGST